MRKYKLLIYLFYINFLFGCKSEFEHFNNEAYAFASDKRINEKEYNKLIEQITESEEMGFQQFKNDKGKVDNQKVVIYLLKYLKAKKIEIAAADIWQPEQKVAKGNLFNINVYLENSASMDGYVNGVTDFETAIYNMLGDFKISGICDSLNLNYINKSITFTKHNALRADIEDFIEKLEPSSFRQRGGDRSTSDISNVLQTVLSTVNDKNAAILISDFVFSPGTNKDAEDYLNNQGVGIKISFAEKLKEFDLSAVVIQLQSDFNGVYYDRTDKPIKINCKRPYYIWVLGSTDQIRTILNQKILDFIKGGYINRIVLQPSKQTKEPNYKILYNPRIGSFSAKELNRKIISDAATSQGKQNKGVFGFNIAVDFGSEMQDAKYYLDSSNYKLSDMAYSIQIDTISDKSNPSLSGFTHLLKMKTNDLREGTLKIEVVGKTPSWVYSSSSIDDSNIVHDNNEKEKTFGFKFLMEGICDAFYPKANSNPVNIISVTIKK
ncbi:MAG: hypothetical protein SFW35_00510 [Chitinophagales bacterium]|nr:hypothetical protein [Chitinophagales bacterium]